jgi:hypothetical protein
MPGDVNMRDHTSLLAALILVLSGRRTESEVMLLYVFTIS